MSLKSFFVLYIAQSKRMQDASLNYFLTQPAHSSKVYTYMKAQAHST